MPRIHSISPSFQLGVPVDFIVQGEEFAAGTQARVTMVSATGFLWTVNTVKVLDANRIRVNATPRTPPPSLRRPTAPAAGVGDLTITVTNGDGTMSPPQAQNVSYQS